MMKTPSLLRSGGHRRRTLGLASVVLTLAVSMVSPPALSQTGPRCSLEGSGGLILVRSAELQTRGVLAVQLGGSYYESLDLALSLGADEGQYAALHVSANYGLATWAELSTDVTLHRASWGAPLEAVVASGLANPRLATKLSLPRSTGAIRVALEAGVWLPVGEEVCVADSSGCEAHLTGGSPGDADVMLLVTADFTERFPLRLHANVGWALNRDEHRGHRFYPDYYPPTSGADTDNDAILMRGAIEFPGRNVDLFTEFRVDILRDRDLVALKENPLTVAPGLRVRFASGWQVTAGLAVALSGDDGDTPEFDPHEAYPDWEAVLALSYEWPLFAADSDDDGIPDLRDDCVHLPEDFDGYDDDDGCPDLDNDRDGIADAQDEAPGIMEDFDGFEDDDGVPDLDNDADGIVDERDMCPDEAEDLDGFEDQDGCPDR